ncbi:hypothetical protein GJ699_09445 [Duganella sp. FT80W]|uniref:Uncharacterized protein n=1 Tax=Duganella guangzhouensis TaxID=2666084 RepID=A0A6I2KYZ6_9BURK|nr:hypothetical protein [Duganella guangzhouensis]MRW90207.1 hypothetical protein [Duganella guangzhouensis]
MKDLDQLFILLGMGAVMAAFHWLIDRRTKAPDDTDVFTLSDSQGNLVKILLNRQATREEREKILNEKIREILQHPTI